MALVGRDGAVRTGDGDFEENYLDVGLRQSLGDLGEASLFFNTTWWTSWQWDDTWAYEIDDASSTNSLQLKHVVSPRLFSREATFTTGLDLSSDQASGEGNGSFGTTESDYRRSLVGLFTHAEIRPLDFLSATASLRYDWAAMDLDRHDSFSGEIDDSRHFDQFSPHAGITARVVEEVSLYASWGRTFKYPRRDELIGFTTFDPQLDPERADVYETGVRARAGTWGSASLTAYYMAVKDEIFYDPFGGPMGWGSNVNFDEVVHQGTEAEGRLTPWEWVELFGTYTYTRVTITDSEPAQEGKTYPVTPPHAATVGAAFRYEGASLTVTGRYAGERYLVNDFLNEGEKLPPYLVYDARVSYTWKWVTGFVAVYNVTDREYYDSGGISFPENRFNPAPERSWMAGGEVRF
jgi:outer membrane receptor protein involved in Fe transport